MKDKLLCDGILHKVCIVKITYKHCNDFKFMIENVYRDMKADTKFRKKEFN